jgi:hypothetical protein
MSATAFSATSGTEPGQDRDTLVGALCTVLDLFAASQWRSPMGILVYEVGLGFLAFNFMNRLHSMAYFCSMTYPRTSPVLLLLSLLSPSYLLVEVIYYKPKGRGFETQ